MNRQLHSILADSIILTAFAAFMIPARAASFLTPPRLLSETVDEGKVTFTWQADTDEGVTGYHITVYKRHKATTDEAFVLAQTDFGHIESTGTMTRHEDRGALWDYLPDCPGWYVKHPLYMRHAIGTDTFNHFPGADIDDCFGGAYMLSPDYDLGSVDAARRTLHIFCQLGNEATSVTGGFALYTWSEDRWNGNDCAYRPVTGHDHQYTDLSNTVFKEYSESCTPATHADRTRICFYGSGYSALWINSLRIEMNLGAGDIVGYPSETIVTDAFPGVNSYTIDTGADTDSDYTYGYIVRGVRADYDDYRGVSIIRLISPLAQVHNIGDPLGSIDSTFSDNARLRVKVCGGSITVEGTAEGTPVKVLDLNGRIVGEGSAGSPIAVASRGVYIVNVADTAMKVVI